MSAANPQSPATSSMRDPGVPTASSGSVSAWPRPGRAFAVALLLEAAVWLIGVLTAYLRAQPVDWLFLLRCEIATSALAALIWLSLRRLAAATVPRSADPLLRLQVWLPLLGGAAALARPAWSIWLQPGEHSAAVLEAASWPGWVAMLGVAAAVGSFVWTIGPRRTTHLLAGLGLLSSVQIACLAAMVDKGNWLAYHVLTAGWAAVAAFLPALTTVSDVRDGTAPQGSPAPLVGSLVAGLLVLLLALRGGREDPLSPWSSAAALFFVSALALDWAVIRHRGVWVFAAGWPLYVAISLVLWHRHQPWDWPTDGLWLARINVLAAGMLALGWLAGSARISLVGSGRTEGSTWLRLQVGLALAGNLALLSAPFTALLLHPQELPASVAAAGGSGGWAALLIGLLAAGRCFHKACVRHPVVAFLVFALPQGVLAACTAARWDRGDWAAYHTLSVAWTLAGAAAAVVASVPKGKYTSAKAGACPAAWPVLVVGLLVIGLGVRELSHAPAGWIWIVAGALLVTAPIAAYCSHRLQAH